VRIREIDNNSNSKILILIFYILNYYITLGLEMWTDLKDKRQLLAIGSYLSLELWDYKYFKYKVIMDMFLYAILPSYIL